MAAFDILVQPRTFDTDCSVKDLVTYQFPFAAIDHANFEYTEHVPKA